jgi:hypothetical protein
MRIVRAAGIPQSNMKVTSIICMRGIFTVPIRGTWMNMPCRRVARIRPLAPRLMRVVRMMVSTLMGLVADMKRFRTAATPTISSKAICIIQIRGTATTTAPSLWPDQERLRVGLWPTPGSDGCGYLNGKRSPTISSLLRHKSLAWARLRAYERTPTREVGSSFTSHTWQSSQ